MNGWQRIGLVLSVLWIVGAGLYQRSADMEKAGKMGGWAMEVCQKVQTSKGSSDFSRCSDEFTKMFNVFAEGSWGNVAFVALAPIPIAWLFVYLIVWLTRWIRRGFVGQAR
jgi:hypothetical protein